MKFTVELDNDLDGNIILPIPNEIMNHLDLEVGDKLKFKVKGDSVIMSKKESEKQYSLDLNEHEFNLISYLVSLIRQGGGSNCSIAAFSLIQKLENVDARALDTCFDKINLNIVVENECAEKIVEIDGSKVIFELSDGHGADY